MDGAADYFNAIIDEEANKRRLLFYILRLVLGMTRKRLLLSAEPWCTGVVMTLLELS